MIMRLLILAPLFVLPACVNTVSSVVTAPFKVAGKAADWATTSQSEADRNRGRKIRKAEEAARKDCKREVEGDLARENCVRERLRAQGIT
jgi:hypothetical protein